MFKISKEFSFDMAHLLDGHDGKCQNLHGHTYKLQVEISGDLYESGAKKAMVIDFSDLKSIVKKVILDPMDHAFIYDQTNEREIARFILNRLHHDEQLSISSIRLWETPT